jgi:hypothetical protein
VGGGDTGGVDHEKVAAGDAFLVEPARFAAGLEGSVVEDEAEAGAVAQGSPPSMSEPALGPWSPRTSASKSLSALPFAVSSPFIPGRPPKLMNSFREVAGALLAPSSCNFRVCSFSTREDNDLISVMYAWNCPRLSSGPRLNCHNMGKTSTARKSLSTWEPIALNTSKAAIL